MEYNPGFSRPLPFMAQEMLASSPALDVVFRALTARVRSQMIMQAGESWCERQSCTRVISVSRPPDGTARDQASVDCAATSRARHETVMRIRALCDPSVEIRVPESPPVAATLHMNALAASIVESTRAAAGAAEAEDAMFLCSDAGRPLLVRRMLAASTGVMSPQMKIDALTRGSGAYDHSERGGYALSASPRETAAVPLAPATADAESCGGQMQRNSDGGSAVAPADQRSDSSSLLFILQAVADADALLHQCSQLYTTADKGRNIDSEAVPRGSEAWK